ncbi:hypothetical protein H072_7652 [Dactylellina haptotyla CBS 200.50]|uniref:Large conductance mechanosensitive channel protein n=1 Tax=Dactylellina haptotyla (strain CBS 200.50) TaxID=1284197 RepID=S8A6R4_DACHA|nr:hypothetical protein H072_7652 [Dactylellina haptotyla CBS 200.50]
MPSSNSDTESLPLINRGRNAVRRVTSVWSGFRDFALRDNVLEVAIGLIVASAFTSVVNSLVADIILPPISLMWDQSLGENFVILKQGHNSTAHYNTFKQAQDDGAITWNYGNFLEKLIQFVVLGATLYSLAKFYSLFATESIIKYQTKCPACKKDISAKAKRCPFCTSWQDGREFNGN